MVDMAWHLHSHHVSFFFLRPTMASKISCGQLWPVKYTPLVGYFEDPVSRVSSWNMSDTMKRPKSCSLKCA